MRGLTLGCVLVTLLSAAAPAGAQEATRIRRVAIGARLGMQVVGPLLPMLGLVASARVGDRWLLTLEWDPTRGFDESLQTSNDTLDGPILLGCLHGGFGLRTGGAKGPFATASAIAGLAAPSLDLSPRSDHTPSGALVEAGLDLEVGVAFGTFHLAAFAKPLWSHGTLRPSCAGCHHETKVSLPSLTAGLGLGVAF